MNSFDKRRVKAQISHEGRPDVWLAWREKVTIFWLIVVSNGTVIFHINAFGHVLCPDCDKARNSTEVS